MHYMVDGHNVLGSMGLLGNKDSIKELIAKLSDYQRRKLVDIDLVFDNKSDTQVLTLYERHGNLHVFGPDPKLDKDADDFIVRRLSASDRWKKVTVVTDDLHLRERLRGIGVKDFMSTKKLMARVEKPLFSRKPDQKAVDDKEEELPPAYIQKQITDEMYGIFGQSDQ